MSDGPMSTGPMGVGNGDDEVKEDDLDPVDSPVHELQEQIEDAFSDTPANQVSCGIRLSAAKSACIG